MFLYCSHLQRRRGVDVRRAHQPPCPCVCVCVSVCVCVCALLLLLLLCCCCCCCNHSCSCCCCRCCCCCCHNCCRCCYWGRRCARGAAACSASALRLPRGPPVYENPRRVWRVGERDLELLSTGTNPKLQLKRQISARSPHVCLAYAIGRPDLWPE